MASIICHHCGDRHSSVHAVYICAVIYGVIPPEDAIVDLCDCGSYVTRAESYAHQRCNRVG